MIYVLKTFWHLTEMHILRLLSKSPTAVFCPPFTAKACEECYATPQGERSCIYYHVWNNEREQPHDQWSLVMITLLLTRPHCSRDVSTLFLSENILRILKDREFEETSASVHNVWLSKNIHPLKFTVLNVRIKRLQSSVWKDWGGLKDEADQRRAEMSWRRDERGSGRETEEERKEEVEGRGYKSG